MLKNVIYFFASLALLFSYISIIYLYANAPQHLLTRTAVKQYYTVQQEDMPGHKADTIVTALTAADYCLFGYNQAVNENYVKAVSYYDSAIALEPANVTAYRFRGYAYYKLNQPESALGSYQKAIELSPDTADVQDLYYNMGEVYFHLSKNYRSACKYYTGAIILNITEHKYYRARGDAWYNLKQWQNALRDYNSAYMFAKAKGENLYDILNYRGDTYLRLGNIKMALNDYREAELIEAFDPDIAYKISLCYNKLNDTLKYTEYSVRADKLYKTGFKYR